MFELEDQPFHPALLWVCLLLGPIAYVIRTAVHFLLFPITDPLGLLLRRYRKMAKTPVYFFSHGGPNIMYDVNHPVYPKLQELGEEIVRKVKPKAVVVFSAHWQADEPGRIEVNAEEKTKLIYDFSGFPVHYYKETFPNVGSNTLAEEIIGLLKSNGIDARPASRGLDHGVWACFKVAFNPQASPLDIPIVQVSLFSSSDPYDHYHLGRALSNLREQNVQIIVSGMAVHNLRDLRYTMMDPTPLPYTVSFDEALKDAVTGPAEERKERMAQLLKRQDARQAHPTFEHLLPLFVGAGAAGEDEGKRLWTLKEGSTSWAQYRFGKVGGA